MRRVGIGAVLLLLLPTACAKPHIDTTSDAAMQKSVARVRASLPEDRRALFDQSLATITMSNFDLSKLLAGSAGAVSIEASVKGALNGKTGEEVIAYADVIKKEQAAKAKAEALAEVKELEEKRAKAEQARGRLAAFEVQRSRFSKVKQAFLGDQPVIELTVKNGTGQPVSRAYFKGTLSSPGRSVPWHRDDFNYSIPGGLEPGETASWKLTPNMFSGWGKADAPADAVLTVEVVKLDGANGQTLFDADGFSEADAARLVSLKASYKP